MAAIRVNNATMAILPEEPVRVTLLEAALWEQAHYSLGSLIDL